jgi:hypothetical protein
MVMDPEMEAEGFTRLTWEIEEIKGAGTKLTVTHELEGAPKLASLLAGEMEEMGACLRRSGSHGVWHSLYGTICVRCSRPPCT